MVPQEHKISWVKKWGIDAILATAIPAVIAVYGGKIISDKITRANFIKEVLPHLVSAKSSEQEIALFAIEVGLDRKTANAISNILGISYGDRVIKSLNQGKIEAARINLQNAYDVSPKVYLKARKHTENSLKSGLVLGVNKLGSPDSILREISISSSPLPVQTPLP